MLASVAASSGLAPPSDPSITSLFLNSVPSTHNTHEQLTAFINPLLPSFSQASSGAGGGGIKSIVPVPATNCAFVNFKSRSDAEEVAQNLAMRNIAPDGKGVKVSFAEEEMGVQWGRPRKAKAGLPKAEKGQEVLATAEEVAVA